jgi:CheY-like chemotaxis protein
MTLILIIEDEEAIRQNITETLLYEGFETLEAENGLVGVQLALQGTPNLILCDVMMPELDGYDVLRQLQGQPQTATIPFIFLTALADRSYVRFGMALGANDYLTKPFTPDELLTTIQTRLAKHAAALRAYTEYIAASTQAPIAAEPATSQSLMGSMS